MRPYCQSCGGGCPSTGCLKAPFVWGFDGCLLRARLNGIDVKPLDLCKWLYCNETDTKMQLVPNGEDSYIEYYSERDINGCENGIAGETDKIYICDLLGLGTLGCLGDVHIEEPKPGDLLVYSPDGTGDDCPGCDEHKKDKWINYTIPNGHIDDNSTDMVAVDSQGRLIKGRLGITECIKRGSTAVSYEKNPYSGIWYTQSGQGTYSSPHYGPVMGTPSFTNETGCTLLVRLDAGEFICSTADDGGAYNFALGLSLQSSRSDIAGRTRVISWDHMVSQSGTAYGSYRRLTLDTRVHQIVRLAPGQSVNWTVRSFRVNYGNTAIMNDDGTTANDPLANRWTIQTWRAD